MKYFTGVGARSTPVWCRYLMEDIASKLCNQGYSLRSGSASGADTAFEIGCDRVLGNGEIYVPWNSFGTGSPRTGKKYHTITPQQLKGIRAFYLKSGILPEFDNLKRSVKLLHARNYLQVLGRHHQVSKVCLFYSETDWFTGAPVGGTRIAYAVSTHFKVPCYNLQNEKDCDKIIKRLNLKPKQHYIDNQDTRGNK